MKTAISLPDNLYNAAEQTARFLEIPRSRLYVLALTEYIDKHGHNSQNITEQLNAVYTQAQAENSITGLEALRKLTKNDAW